MGRGIQPGAQMIGWKWHCSRGNQACEECQSKHGQVYMYNPGPGENSIFDLRRPPIHPYCRCLLVEISVFRGGDNYAPKGDTSTPIPHWPWIRGGILFLGLLWGNNNRDISNGPVYGKYGGQNWTAGRNLWDPDDPGADDDTPVDDMDEAFARHDYNYTIMSTWEADRILFEELKALPRDTNKWRTPPFDPDYANRYRRWATYFFGLGTEEYDPLDFMNKGILRLLR